MPRMTGPIQRVACPLLLMLAAGVPLHADEGITVLGTGKVDVMPDRVEMSGVVTADAELAADATVKFNDNKRRAVEALEALGIEGLGVEGQGFMVSTATGADQMQMIMRGQVPDTSTAQVRISEQLKITLSGVSDMSVEDLSGKITSIIDAGKDAGVTLGGAITNIIELQVRGNRPQPMAVFSLSDPSSALDKAYAAAMADARKNAERLASLAGVKLGKVVSVTQKPVPTGNDSASSTRAMIAMMYGVGSGSDDKPIHSDTFTPIPVAVNLQVQYAIE